MYLIEYGIEPEIISKQPIECNEMMFYLYLPIKMASGFSIKIPDRLKIFRPLVELVVRREGIKNLDNKYIYLTAKHVYITPDNPANRPGYHSDGFLTDDINYIWYDKHPTVFCVQKFNVAENHEISMKQFEEQAKVENEVTYPNQTVLRLTPAMIHRTPDLEKGDMRTFVKISISKYKYNLIGNSHNYLFDYNWRLYPRNEVRNHPIYKEADFVPED